MASSTSGAPAATAAVRSAPTWTQVPEASLKSSAMRPSKARPWAASSGSTSLPASPMRKKPSSSKAAAVRSGRLQ